MLFQNIRYVCRLYFRSTRSIFAYLLISMAALLLAMLRPMEELKMLEYEGNTTKRLALLEEVKMLPAGLVWDYFCESQNVPGREWIKDLKTR